jgi:hypothetical protein
VSPGTLELKKEACRVHEALGTSMGLRVKCECYTTDVSSFASLLHHYAQLQLNPQAVLTAVGELH